MPINNFRANTMEERMLKQFVVSLDSGWEFSWGACDSCF